MDWGLTSLQNPYAGSGTIRTRRSIDNVAQSDPQGGADLQAQQMQQPAPTAPPALAGSSTNLNPLDVMNDLFVRLHDKVKGGDIKAIDDEIASLNKTASSGPSPLSLQMNNLLTQARSANSLADWLKNNPQAAPELQHAQNVSPLQLPEVPQNVQPTANPIASLGAGIAGLFAPRSAGAFGAAALQGAITATDKLNAAKRQQYQFDLQQSLLKHEDDVRRADAQARIEAQNAAVKNAYSADQHADNMKQAVLRSDASQKEGSAGNLKAFIEGSGPADAAKNRQAQLLQMRKEASAERVQAYKTTADVASSIAQLNLERDKMQQTAAQFQQGRQDAQQKAQMDLDRYAADRASREKIANQRAALDDKMNLRTDATARYNIITQHNDRVARLIQEDKNTGSVIKDPKTYETIAAGQVLDDASARLKLAEEQLYHPSIDNPNYIAPTNTDEDKKRAATHKLQEEVQYATRLRDAARADYLQIGADARKRLGTSKEVLLPGQKTSDPLGILGR